MVKTFAFNGIIYSVISERFRTVRTGNNSETGPNAVLSSYNQPLDIPNQVKDSAGRYYRITEIGSYSFYKCLGITSVSLPASIEIIRIRGLSGLQKCRSLTFEQNSRLKIIEEQGLYDFYLIESLVFTSNCLRSIGNIGITFAFALKTLVIPSSVKYIGRSGIGGMKTMQKVYYCGSKDQEANIFQTSSQLTQMNPSFEVYVSSKYKGDTFAGRTIKGRDDSVCEQKTDICSDMCITIKKSKHTLHLNLMFVCVMLK